MAFEVACSECQGRLMVEQAGVIVACPHCGAHLNIEAPSEAPAQTDSPSAPEDHPEVDSSPQETVATLPEGTETVPAPESDQPAEATADSSLPVADEQIAPEKQFESPQQFEPTSPAETAPAASPPEHQAPAVSTPPVDPADTLPEIPTVSMQPPDIGAEAHTLPAETSSPETTSQGKPAESMPENAGTNAPAASVPARRGVSHHTFSLVRNYAIAMTIAVVILVYKLLTPNLSALESLPDIKPQKKDDKIVYKLVPESAEMPPGHLLSLGQSQRFGNLNVTPVRVTREPVEFIHHQGNEAITRDATSDVVKLWFRFENLSTDQSIAPLDGLVFKRDDNDFENVRSNNFVCRQSEKKKGGKLVFVYDHLITGQWDLRNQHAEREIAPGESLETYIPTTEEGIAQLMSSDEPLIWRVQFRKGYSPKNYGVTTVIEVAFKSSDIGAATPAAPAKPNTNT